MSWWDCLTPKGREEGLRLPWARDVSGTVEKVGPGVKNLTKGDKVFGQTAQADATMCVVQGADLARVPDGMDLVSVAALPTVTTHRG